MNRFILPTLQVAIVLMVVGIAVAWVNVAPVKTQDQVTQESYYDLQYGALTKAVNKERKNAGLQELPLNDKLNQSAQMKANDMVKNDYWSHISPAGFTPWHWFEQAGYEKEFGGENLAKGFDKADEVVAAWMDSPSHKANLLNKNYREMGFGEAKRPNGTVVIVNHFGSTK